MERNLNGVKFILHFCLGSVVGKIYRGEYEFEVIAAIKGHIKPGSAFIDIGANIGYLSAIGAGLVGKKGSVHSFEPVNAYFERVREMAKLNPDYNIVVNNLALSESCGTAFIAIGGKDHIAGNSMVPGFIGDENIASTTIVSVKRLDEHIDYEKLCDISLTKIGVEGFELPVLKRASAFFRERNNDLPVIIVEITNWAYDLLERDITELEDFMSSYGYKAYCVFGKHRFDIKKMHGQANRLSTDILFKT